MKVRHAVENRRVIAVQDPASNPAGAAGQSLAWVPSQRQPFEVCLQPQKNSLPSFSAVCLTGVNSDPLWLPSQNGCFADLPQAHQK